MKEKRKPIPKKVREQIYEKYYGHCAYCGCEIEYKEMQVDHIDSVQYNNKLSNLRYVTTQENNSNPNSIIKRKRN